MNKKSVKLSAKWQLDAALLSRPVDLTPLVSLSRSNPDKFLEDNTLHRLVTLLLNEQDSHKSDKDTKLDVLNILANVSGGSKDAVAEVRLALQGISEWFDNYMSQEESNDNQEPELHKAMVLLLARCWNYKLKTEDVLELTQGNRSMALCTVVGLLEDGETYSTELKQRQKPSQGKMGQWEHELVCQRYEKPLLLQICRLLRGFTHPGTYFATEGDEIQLYSVDRFSDEMNTLLEITMQSRLVEKLSVAMYDSVFEDDDEDEDANAYLNDSDHMAVASVHAFLQNLYFYATLNNDEYRRHMLMDTLLIPRFILPYLDRCVVELHAQEEEAAGGAGLGSTEEKGDDVAGSSMAELVRGISASLRTLVISTFRAPATQFVMTLMRRLNPTASILKAYSFCASHDYIFSLLCLLNVNMGALDLSRTDQEHSVIEAYHANALLHELATVYSLLSKEAQTKVYQRVVSSSALPVSRDTPSYVAVMSVLHGGAAGQLEYTATPRPEGKDEGDEDHWSIRQEAKRAHAERMEMIRQATEESKEGAVAEEYQPMALTAFQTAVAVARAAEPAEPRKEDKAESKSSENKGESKKASAKEEKRGPPAKSLLGELPSLAPPKVKAAEVKVALALELPGESTKPVPRMMVGGKALTSTSSYDPSIPKEFLCAINGHVMKEPVRAVTSGLVFERSTIELWLNTRGSVCPITCQALTLEQLEPANDLRSRIMRFHIQQTTMRVTPNKEDDLYDF